MDLWPAAIRDLFRARTVRAPGGR